MEATKIRVEPEVAIVDEEIEIIVSNSEPNSPVTVSVSIVYFDILYLGYGHFYCDSNGGLNLKHDPSYGGTYRGVEPMGLISSMKAMPSKHACPRFLVKGSVEQSLPFEINLWKGHLTQDQVHHLHIKHPAYGTKYPSDNFQKEFILDTCVLQRTYISPNVERIVVKIEVEGEPIRGTLFVPKHKGPFPGIIDLFGGSGGCVEFRAALLAKYGYAALALAYFDFDGLKAETSTQFKMSYFDKASDWFSKHPLVRPGGIGIVGISLGAEIALLTSFRNDIVKATVCINTSLLMHGDPNIINPLVDDENRETYEIWRGQKMAIYGRVFPVDRPLLKHKQDNPILFLLGSEDPSNKCVNDVLAHLMQSGKKNVHNKIFQGLGHIIEPPYWPLCAVNSPRESNVVSTNPNENLWKFVQQYWGGAPKNYGKLQLEAWRYLLEFFDKNLKPDFRYSKL